VIRAFVFDLDGTLVETEKLKALSYARAATELRPELDEGEVVAAFEDFVGLSRQEVAVGLMRRFGLEGAALARVGAFGVESPWQVYLRIRLRYYEALLSDSELVFAHRYPHNIALLRDVRGQGYPAALATQSHRRETLRVLEILGIEDEFDVIVTREDVEHGKPDPEMHLLAARELGVAAGECLAIEDSPAGIKAALASGAQAIAVTTDLTRRQFRDTDILDRSHVVDDPRALPALVRRLTDATVATSGEEPDSPARRRGTGTDRGSKPPVG
jgi:HAD superfamily hydrolase (TIGR01509 family)